MLDITNYSNFFHYVLNFNYNIGQIINIFFIFLLGITFGSFLTMLIYRLFFYEDAMYNNEKEEAKKIMRTILYGRSYCPVCKKTLEPKYLVPLFSYLFLRGKCGNCGSKIPISYFLIEIGLGFIFVFLYLYFKYIGLFSTDAISIFNIVIFFILLISIVVLYGLLLYDIKYLYLSYILNNIGYVISGILLSIGFLFNYKLGLFILFFILFNYVLFYGLNLFAKLYYGIKVGFNSIKDIEVIGIGDFYALINILTFTGFILGYKNINILNNLNFTILNSYIYIFGQVIIFFIYYIIISSIITLIYYVITLILDYKNEEQVNTEKELKDKNITGTVIPFLPGLIISGLVILLFI